MKNRIKNLLDIWKTHEKNLKIDKDCYSLLIVAKIKVQVTTNMNLLIR